MTAALAPHWWRAACGFSPALPGLPGRDAATACLSAPGAVVIGVRGHDGERTAARLAIRQALAAALAGLTGLPGSRIALCTAPGQAPHALLSPDSDAAARRVALSISHDGELSLAAIRLADLDEDDRGRVGSRGSGGIGIDLMRAIDIPDWRAVAHDYLGADAARRLAGLADAQRPFALARAWSEREARLKCLGLPLEEWDGAGARAVEAACACLALDLPDPYRGALALA